MAGNDRPDPMELLGQLFSALTGGDAVHKAKEYLQNERPWESAQRATAAPKEPSAAQQRENLTFALATRAVEALEDIALNTAAIRQRLERKDIDRPEPPTADGFL